MTIIKRRPHASAHAPRRASHGTRRVFDSSGPAGRIRGTAAQLIERYLACSQEAQLANNRVAAETALQFAEHYRRVLDDVQE